ncbi:uncharacterized protein LOC115227977 [Octopus sinensis]|uniref:Uncharacterized protein LOC115227977 n=1 Tax=Octopus sinensis TaxID=2607531 RepID=A0A6P7TRY1_9MOLL|nr:uncharacterized protein LOC115227977 [Octopus sinensis]
MSEIDQSLLTPLTETQERNEPSSPLSRFNSSSPTQSDLMEFCQFVFKGVPLRTENYGKTCATLGYLGSIDLSSNNDNSNLEKAILFTFSRRKVQETVELKISGGGLSLVSPVGFALAVYPTSCLISFAYFGIQVRHILIAVLHGIGSPKKPIAHLFFDTFDDKNPTPFVHSNMLDPLTRLFPHSDTEIAVFLRKMGFIILESSLDEYSVTESSLVESADEMPPSSWCPSKFPIMYNREAVRGVRLLDSESASWSCPTNSVKGESEQSFPGLRTVLSDKRMCKLFKNYAEGEFSGENVMFWKRVERYKKIGNPEKVIWPVHWSEEV